MRVAISSAALQQLCAAAAASPDAEVCGLLFGTDEAVDDVAPCRNVAEEPARRFELDPASLFAAHRAMRAGGARLIGHYHSHPGGRTEPSPTDAAHAVADGALWLIATDRDVTAWRAVANGPLHGRFTPVAITATASGCADVIAPSEGAQFEEFVGESSR